MWMEVTPTGKYKFVERYRDPYTEKEKKVSVTLSSKSRVAQKQAQRELNEIIEKRLNTFDYSDPTKTFEDVTNEWELQYAQQVKSSSLYSSRYSFVTIYEEIPKDTLIKNIDYLLLNNALENFLYGKRNLSNAYVSKLKSRINAVLRFAVRKGYLETNPMTSVDVPYKREEETDSKNFFLDVEEFTELIEIVRPHNKTYSLLFEWLYLNGLRAGEALGLKKSDVSLDFEKEDYKLTISGTLEYHGKKIADQKKANSTKTQASMRVIDLSRKSVDIFLEAVEHNSHLDTDYLFSTSKGTPIQITAINAYLRTYVKPKLSFDKKLSSHIFRHSHVSRLAELGVPLYVIQDRVGHENSKITESIYLHVTKGVKDGLKDTLEKI